MPPRCSHPRHGPSPTSPSRSSRPPRPCSCASPPSPLMSSTELRAAVSRAVLRDSNNGGGSAQPSRREKSGHHRSADRGDGRGDHAASHRRHEQPQRTPQKQPQRRKTDGERLRSALKNVAVHAAVDGKRAKVLRDGGQKLVQAMEDAALSGDPALLRLGALVFARLSAEADAAALLARGGGSGAGSSDNGDEDGIYLAVVDAVLGFDVRGLRDSADIARIKEGRRLAARGVRNLAAFGEQNAVAVARGSGVVGKLVAVMDEALVDDGSSGGNGGGGGVWSVGGEVVEACAAIANLSRYGWKFQAYVRKHDGLRVLVRAASLEREAAVVFHAMRALAEFSLEQRWQAQLIDERVVAVSLRVIAKCRDEEIVGEATRCVGNVAASRTGRTAILAAGGVEVVVRRVVMLARLKDGAGGGRADRGGGAIENGRLAADLLRAMANLCVGSKDASQRVIDSGGVMALISACDQDDEAGSGSTGQGEEARKTAEAIKTEAFRGLLIIAQAGPSFRATVLREIGVRTRNESAFGRCTAHLYDLARRVKVEASTEHKDDVPQTIAGLGEASKDYLFKAGPLACRARGGGGGGGGNSRRGRGRRGAAVEEDDDSDSPHSLPGMESPSTAAFRQSGRILSVQRPQHHRARLEKERQMRGRSRECAACNCTIATGAGVVAEGSYTEDGRMAGVTTAGSPSSMGRSEESTTHCGSPSSPGCDVCNCGSGAASSSITESRVTSSEGTPIPRCKVVEAPAVGTVARTPMANLRKQDAGGKGEGGRREAAAASPGASADDGKNNWAMQVWSFVCKPLARPPKQEVEAGDLEEDVFELGTPLGRGGFATVFLAKNLRTEELVAVKRFHPVSSALPDAKKKAELAARRALKEQRIWDGLRHRNIVAYKGCFFGEEGELNLVAEYIPGWSLADHLSQISKFPEHLVARITKQIVDGLDYLHREGVTHRDIKPANILVDPSGIVKLTDFGVSSALDVPTMTGNTLVGTPWYIAPEMIEGRPYGMSVDIWSLGCTVLELATGKRPYHELRAHEVMFRVAQDRKAPPIPSSVSPKLRDFLLTCFIWSPEKRPHTAHLRRHPFLAKI